MVGVESLGFELLQPDIDRNQQGKRKKSSRQPQQPKKVIAFDVPFNTDTDI
jgi:hypothetical protein